MYLFVKAKTFDRLFDAAVDLSGALDLKRGRRLR